MDLLDRALARLARHRRRQRLLERTLPLAGVSAAIAAAAITGVRLAVPDGGWLVTALAVGAVLAPCVIIPTAWRTTDPAWQLAAELDQLCAAEGLAMAMAERPRTRAWLDRLEPRLLALRLPALRWTGLLPATLALLLLAGASLLPQAQPHATAAPLLGSLLRQTDDAITTAKAQHLAPPETLATWDQRLADLREHSARNGLDQQTWAALDALNQEIASERADAARRLGDALRLSEQLGNLAAGGQAAATATAAAELAQAMAELAQRHPGLGLQLPGGGAGAELMRLAAQAAAGGQLTDEQRQLLERWGLQGAKTGSGGIDPQAAAALAQRLGIELAAHAAASGLANAGGGQVQPGGPMDGGGHSPLTWGEALRVPGGARERLSGGQVLDPNAGEVVATQARTPETPPEATVAPSAAHDHAATAADARRAQVPARHRAAVSAYFASQP